MPASSTPHPIARSGTVAIAGRTNVGKSTLLNAALGDAMPERAPLAIVTPKPQTTRDAILGVVRRAGAEIALLDTPGLHRPHAPVGRQMNAIAREAARSADVVVFVTALAGRPRPPLVPHPGDLVLLADIGAGTPTVLVINKIDRLGARDRAALLPLVDAFSRLRDFAAIVPICALRADGIDRVLDEVAKCLPRRPAVHEPDFVTDRSVRFLAAEYVREQLILATEQEVPHLAQVSVERFEEQPALVQVEATIRCARPGHRAIVIGRGGARLKAIGTAAREKIEALVGKKVNLRIWVEVGTG
jgi:GTP-binding protein Era